MIYVACVLILTGAGFCIAAALGLLRFPDVYTRLHAASKAGPLGAGLILVGAGFASADVSIIVRCVLGFAFLILTSPVSAHLLARASLLAGQSPDARTSIDEYPR